VGTPDQTQLPVQCTGELVSSRHQAA